MVSRLGEGMGVDLVEVVLAMKAVRTMERERGAQTPQMLAMVMLVALLPAPSLR